MRRFELVDTGKVMAEGCVFSNGKTAITWMEDCSSCEWWDSIGECTFINCTRTNRQFRWVDESN